jgi:plasmid stabilization system protein ParE
VSRPIVLTEEARKDIEDARIWYLRRSDVLGRDFVRSLRLCLDGIEQFPERHPIVHRNIRRALMRRFPYMVLYVPLGDASAVIGCLHIRRDPRDWQAR